MIVHSFVWNVLSSTPSLHCWWRRRKGLWRRNLNEANNWNATNLCEIWWTMEMMKLLPHNAFESRLRNGVCGTNTFGMTWMIIMMDFDGNKNTVVSNHMNRLCASDSKDQIYRQFIQIDIKLHSFETKNTEKTNFCIAIYIFQNCSYSNFFFYWNENHFFTQWQLFVAAWQLECRFACQLESTWTNWSAPNP